MRFRTFVILLIFVGVVIIDVFTSNGNWWFETKIVIIWGAILGDAFLDSQKSWIGKLSLLAGIFLALFVLQTCIKHWVQS